MIKSLFEKFSRDSNQSIVCRQNRRCVALSPARHHRQLESKATEETRPSPYSPITINGSFVSDSSRVTTPGIFFVPSQRLAPSRLGSLFQLSLISELPRSMIGWTCAGDTEIGPAICSPLSRRGLGLSVEVSGVASSTGSTLASEVFW